MERAEQRDPDALADEVEEQTNELGRHSEELEEKVIEVRRDWERKRSDPGVPGAPEPESRGSEDAEGESPAKESPPEDAGADPPAHTGETH
jgi:hypothetical protein